MVLTSYNVGSLQTGSSAFIWNYNNVGKWPEPLQLKYADPEYWKGLYGALDMQISIIASFAFEITAILMVYIGGLAKDWENKMKLEDVTVGQPTRPRPSAANIAVDLGRGANLPPPAAHAAADYDA